MTRGIVTVRVDTEDLDAKAKAAGLTRSEYVRQLIAGLGPGNGAWVAYYLDMSAAAVFATEVDALRYAQSNSMEVKFVEYGKRI